LSGAVGKSVVWDYVAVYQPGKLWDQSPPDAVYSDRPVVRAIGGTSEAMKELLKETSAVTTPGIK
jgi:hypothetical protein